MADCSKNEGCSLEVVTDSSSQSSNRATETSQSTDARSREQTPVASTKKLKQGLLHFSPGRSVAPPSLVSPSPNHPTTPPSLVSPSPNHPTPPSLVSPSPNHPTTPPSLVSPSPNQPTTPPSLVSPSPNHPTTPPSLVSPSPNQPTTPPSLVSPSPNQPTTPTLSVANINTPTNPIIIPLGHNGATPPVCIPVLVIPAASDPKPKLTKQQREEQRVEKAAKKEEERLKKEQEKQLREQEKREKQMKREQELRERREKREREELEKKERKEKREAEKKKREEERRKKEEERQRKLEEKKRLEQEKELIKEEKLRRENQQKLKFRGYFGKVEKPVIKKDSASSETLLTPFSVKDGMSLAKPPRDGLGDTTEFDQLILQQNSNVASNYVQTCKQLAKNVGRSSTSRKSKVDNEDDSVVIVDSSENKESEQSLPRFKLLQFAENHRPAYYGTWRKQKGSINPRNPLKKDEDLLDYSIDSDDEWEEEEPGESISCSEGDEKEGEADGEDSDEEDGFFVPHGYLSNDEGDCDDNIPAPGEDPQDSKRKKQLAKAWEVEFARKCQPLEPKVIGCLWLQPQLVSTQEERVLSKGESFLLQFAAVPLVALPLPMPTTSKGETSAEKPEGQESCGKESMKQLVPEEAMPDLIRLIHKSPIGVNKIVKTFRTHWGAKISMNSPNPPPNPTPDKVDSTPKSTTNPSQYQEYANISGISKRQLEKKIQAIATKEVRLPLGRLVWYVHDSVMKQYGLEQENLTPLMSDNSPILSPRLPDCQPPFKTPEIANQAGKAVKRKSNGAGKSLLQFLSKSPLAPSPKRIKCDLTSEKGQEEVIIIDPLPGPPVSVRDPPQPPPQNSLEEETLTTPLAKRLCLEQISSKGESPSDLLPAESPTSITNLPQDILHSTANTVLHKEMVSV